MNQIRLFINQRETIALKIIIQRVWRLIAPSRLICAYFDTNYCVQLQTIRRVDAQFRAVVTKIRQLPG